MVIPVTGKPTVLVVDDMPENIAILTNLFKDRYRTLVSTTGKEALEMARRPPRPDLILLDVMMADLDGFEVCRRLKADPATEEIPIIFVTSQSNLEDEKKGLELGAVDYVTKPISPSLVLARVKTHLNQKAIRDFLRDKNEFLESEVVRRTREIALVQDATMVAFGSLAETRDNETGAHIQRTQLFMKLLATKASYLEPFRSELDRQRIEILFKSAPLHDIGKVGIPDQILLKPGRLEPDEFEIMKTHTTLGALAIRAAERRLGERLSFLTQAKIIASTHHERWDGKGYPAGLQEEAIPLAGRLMAISDVYDALRSERIYKPAFPHDKTVDIMLHQSSGQFDPRLLEIFESSSDEWAQTYESFEGF